MTETKQNDGATLADWLKTEHQKKIIELMWGKITEEEYLAWLQSEKKEPCDEQAHAPQL